MARSFRTLGFTLILSLMSLWTAEISEKFDVAGNDLENVWTGCCLRVQCQLKDKDMDEFSLISSILNEACVES